MNATITTEQAINCLLATNPELVNIHRVNIYLTEVFSNVLIDITKLTPRIETFEDVIKQLNDSITDENNINARLINGITLSVLGSKLHFSMSYLPTQADLNEIENF